MWVIAATTKPAGLSKDQCGIEMAAGPTAAPVREHDQRELRLYPGDRANLAFVSGYLDEFKIGRGQRPPEIIERHVVAAITHTGVSRPHRSSRQPGTALVLLDADCIMTCPAIVPTAELGVLFEMPKQRGSH